MQVIVIDARNMCYRFGHVGRGLKSGSGQETGAIHGVLMGMTALKHHYPRAKFVVVWDGMETNKTWRVGIFPEYKAQRRANPDQEQAELRASVCRQIDIIKGMVKAVGVPQIEIPRLEADDVVGILSEKLAARGWEVIVYSSDQDYLQLMVYGVKVITSASSGPMTETKLMQKWRCGSADLLKLRAMLGDHSDGIPRAVSGVGPIAAAKYVAAGIDAEVPRFDDLPRAVREEAERLRAPWPLIHRNWRLMRIVRSCHDPDFPKELVGKVATETRRILKELTQPVVRDQVVYHGMLAAMAELDMVEAISNRSEIWNLQVTKDRNLLT